MSIYSFLIAVRSDGQQLMNESGETTSHLMGMFYRTLRMCDNGIKPLYVFDGAPPKLKSGELARRYQRKQEANEGLEEAKETGTAEDVEKFSRRTVRVTKEHNAECQRLLKLMGIPYLVAPTEAEAQCAVLARAGKVYAAASEDMDTLCFNTPILLRHLTFSEQRKEPIQEIHLDKVLDGLNMDRKQVCGSCAPSPPNALPPCPLWNGNMSNQCVLLSSSLTSAFSSAATTSTPFPRSAPTLPSSSFASTAASRRSSSPSRTTRRANLHFPMTGHSSMRATSSSSLMFGPPPTRSATSSGTSRIWTGLCSSW